VGYAQNLMAMRAEIDVALAQKSLEQLHPKRRQFGGTVRTDRLNILFAFQIRHLAILLFFESTRIFYYPYTHKVLIYSGGFYDPETVCTLFVVGRKLSRCQTTRIFSESPVLRLTQTTRLDKL
jgi:hypothetical protein